MKYYTFQVKRASGHLGTESRVVHMPEKEVANTQRGTTADPGKNESTSNVVFADDSNLQPLKLRPRLTDYLKDLWRIRHFVWNSARSSSFGAGRNMFLGKLWILLDPLLQVSVYAVIFGFVLKTSRGIDNFIGFLVIGVTFFRVATKGISGGSGLIQKSRPMISSFHFPRAAIPLAHTVNSFLDNIFPCLMGIVVALLFQADEPVSWTVLLAVPIFILMHIFSLGATLCTSRITAFIPDAKGFIQVFIRGLFFVSGVFFSIDRFDDSSLLHDIMALNPIYQFLSAVRVSVLDGSVPSIETWLYISAWSFLLATFGLVYFWQKEASYAQVK